jgi:hypothetical protein
MKKKTIATCGCWFGFTVIVGPVAIYCCYKIVHSIYDISKPGGHHFGGGDLAEAYAFIMAISLGPLVGIAFALLSSLPFGTPRDWASKTIGALVLLSIPFCKFILDAQRYRVLNLRVEEAKRQDAERHAAAIKGESPNRVPVTDH